MESDRPNLWITARILDLVGKEGPISMGEIQSELGMPYRTFISHMNRLAEMDLVDVEHHEDDSLTILTRRGERSLERLREVVKGPVGGARF
ncbi:MAG: winged helix-turn-helix transcriptional regulator [Methanomassiliicoccales archaeon]